MCHRRSGNKACSPTGKMSFVGVLFNSETMTIEITEERLNGIKLLLRIWLKREKASLKDIQSLIGKLNFVAACVKPGRIFISRLIKWLKVLYKEKPGTLHIIPEFAKMIYYCGTGFYCIIVEYQ